MATTLDAPPRARPPRARRRTAVWITGGIAVLVAAAFITWLVVGLHPHLSSGNASGSSTAVSEAGDVTGRDTGASWFVDTGDGEAYAIVRNEGRAPVTLRSAGVTLGLEQVVRFAPIVRAYDRFGSPADSITLAPGEEAQLLVDLRNCTTYSQGSSGAIDGVDVRATTWGLTTKRHLALGRQYGFYAKSGTLPRSSACTEPF